MTTSRPPITDEQAALIGRRWDKNGTVRYYINDWPAILGFEIGRSRSGAIQYCHIPGVEMISNRKAAELLCGKAWIENGKLYAQIDWEGAGIPEMPMQDAIRAEIARRQGA